MIPVEQVRTGFSLAIDRGQGRQLFQVEEVAFHSERLEGGNYLNTYTFTSEPVDGGDPWVIQYPAGTRVCRILGPSKS